MVFFSTVMNAQQYDGETNKKGEPHGRGVMTFNYSDGLEKIEGTFQKGIPVEGKSMRYDQYGRLKMEFEGTFRPKEKGKFAKLSDLLFYGSIAFFYYEDGKNFGASGYYVVWGNYDGDRMTSNQSLGVKNLTSNTFPNDRIKNYVNYLFPLYAYDLMKDQGDTPYSHLAQNQTGFDVLSATDKSMEHYTMLNINGTEPNTVPNGAVYGLAFKGNDQQQLHYFKGEFENGQLQKIITLKQYFRGGKVRNLYAGGEPQKITPFFSQNDFLASFYVGGEDFSPEGGKSQLLRLRTLLNIKNFGKDKASVENTKVICAYHLTHPSYRTIGVYEILNDYPEIATAKNVPLTWDGSKVINMNDAYMRYLRQLRDSSDIYAFFNYHDIYHDWGDMTEEEKTDDELNYVLTTDPGVLNRNYEKHYPKGHFVGMDFYKEGWAMAYIFHCQRILRKNDPKIWVDKNNYISQGIPWHDWMHYPRLSRNIGEYSNSTSMSKIFGYLKEAPRDLMFNQRALSFLQELFSSSKYIFSWQDKTVDENQFRSGVFRVLEQGGINDVAKTYRKLMDAIGLAVLIDDTIGETTDVTNYSYSYAKWSACHVAVEYMIDGYAASVALAESEPKILPACKKAQELFKKKFDLLQKKVFIHDDKWAAAISEYNREVQSNKEAYNKMRQEIENLSLPKYEYVENTWQEQPNGDYTRKISFPDLTDVSRTTVIKDAKGAYYQAITGAFLRTKYKTERDAIIASYAYLKYGEVRQKGRY